MSTRTAPQMDLDEALRQRGELRDLLVQIVRFRYLDDAQRTQTNVHRQRDILEIATRAESLIAQTTSRV